MPEVREEKSDGLGEEAEGAALALLPFCAKAVRMLRIGGYLGLWACSRACTGFQHVCCAVYLLASSLCSGSCAHSHVQAQDLTTIIAGSPLHAAMSAALCSVCQAALLAASHQAAAIAMAS